MIVVDIDGVIADSDEWLIKEIQERSGKPVMHKSPRVFQYGIDIPEKDLLLYINDAIIKYKDTIDPHDYGRTFIGLLMLERVYGRVDFLSARSPIVKDATQYWLENFFEGLDFRLNVLGENQSKRKWMIDNGFDSIIEDRLRTANEVNFTNGKTYLVNREWNEGRHTEPHVIRVSEVYDAIEDYLCMNTEE